MQTWDVAVIGSGIAGTAAALAASARGAAVALVDWKPGATALSNGGWRGPLPPALADLLKRADYELVRAESPLFSPDGARTSADYAAATHVTTLEPPVLVCGIAGLPFFHAPALALLWSEGDAAFEAATITVANTPATGWAPAALSDSIDRDVTPLAGALRAAVQAHRARTIILPAVLGVEHVGRTRATLEHMLECRIVEALGSPPSIPGWRLHRALRRAREQAGIREFEGAVVARRAQTDTLVGITVRGAEETTLQARSFVLATGKFAGGGIDAEHELRESALDLPVWIEHLGERFERNEPLTLTNADRNDDQALLTLGVNVDDNGRPGNGGDPIYRNVWLAGAVRRGLSLTLGDAATEGWNAGERAAA